MRYMGSESNRGAGFAEGESALATIQYFDSRSETGFWEMCRTAHIWSHKSIHGSNELEVEEIIANEPATLEQIFVAEMHPCICCFGSNRGRSPWGSWTRP